MLGTMLPARVGAKTREPESVETILESRVRIRLDACGYPELAHLKVNVEGRIVRLDGTTTSYYLKQIAQTIVMLTDEVAGIDNAISVVK